MLPNYTMQQTMLRIAADRDRRLADHYAAMRISCLMLVLALFACSKQAIGSKPRTVTAPAVAPDSEQPPIPDVLTGGRILLQLDDPPTSNLEERLHFRAFDNGANDLIYVGVKYGMWSRGEFDLSRRGKVVYTGHIEHLLYEGALLNMGDVLGREPQDGELSITRVQGWFK